MTASRTVDLLHVGTLKERPTVRHTRGTPVMAGLGTVHFMEVSFAVDLKLTFLGRNGRRTWNACEYIVALPGRIDSAITDVTLVTQVRYLFNNG